MNNYMEKTIGLLKKMKLEEERALLYRNEIVELNLRLVAHILKKYRPYTDDQYQAGCMGLIVAVDTFDETRNIPFPLYACFCIEREIHKMHRKQERMFENVFKDNLVYLDDTSSAKQGDDEALAVSELIADPTTDDEFMKVLQDNDLEDFFSKVVIQSVEEVAYNTKGQQTKFDIKEWISLEIRYILELAEIDSQKARLNLSTIAKILGMSPQNIRMRHQRVINVIKHRCNNIGYHIKDKGDE
jgi:RNA polymerase sigma factor (sigma-70 family)